MVRVCVLFIAILCGTSVFGNPYQDLKAAILNGYDAGARPGDPSSPIKVEVALSPNTIRIEEWHSAVHTDAFLLLTWQDERLVWDSDQYSGVSSLRLHPSSVWIPDVVLQNEIPTFSTAIQAMEKLVLVYKNGTVLWVPSVSLKAACGLDVRHFPRDIQRCKLMFGSWTYDNSEIELVLPEEAIRRNFAFESPSPWYLKASYAEKKENVYPGIEGVYPSINFIFYLHRHVGSYCITLYTPILASIIAGITSLLLCDRRTPVSASVTSSLLIVLVLVSVIMYHGSTLRISGCIVPCIFQFVGGLIMLEVAVLPLKVLLGKYLLSQEAESAKETNRALPRFAKAIVNFKLFCKPKKDGEDDAFLLASEMNQKNNEDWVKLGCVLSFLIGVVYFMGLGLLTWIFVISA